MNPPYITETNYLKTAYPKLSDNALFFLHEFLYNLEISKANKTYDNELYTELRNKTSEYMDRKKPDAKKKTTQQNQIMENVKKNLLVAKDKAKADKQLKEDRSRDTVTNRQFLNYLEEPSWFLTSSDKKLLKKIFKFNKSNNLYDLNPPYIIESNYLKTTYPALSDDGLVFLHNFLTTLELSKANKNYDTSLYTDLKNKTDEYINHKISKQNQIMENVKRNLLVAKKRKTDISDTNKQLANLNIDEYLNYLNEKGYITTRTKKRYSSQLNILGNTYGKPWNFQKYDEYTFKTDKIGKYTNIKLEEIVNLLLELKSNNISYFEVDGFIIHFKISKNNDKSYTIDLYTNKGKEMRDESTKKYLTEIESEREFVKQEIWKKRITKGVLHGVMSGKIVLNKDGSINTKRSNPEFIKNIIDQRPETVDIVAYKKELNNKKENRKIRIDMEIARDKMLSKISDTDITNTDKKIINEIIKKDKDGSHTIPSSFLSKKDDITDILNTLSEDGLISLTERLDVMINTEVDEKKKNSMIQLYNRLTEIQIYTFNSEKEDAKKDYISPNVKKPFSNVINIPSLKEFITPTSTRPQHTIIKKSIIKPKPTKSKTIDESKEAGTTSDGMILLSKQDKKKKGKKLDQTQEQKCILCTNVNVCG